LKAHLKAGGITIRPVRVHAPASSRAGYVVTIYDAATVAKIVAHLGLKPCAPRDPGLRWCLSQQGLTVGVKDAWGLTGRPVSLKLCGGGQFEYFYAVLGTDGNLYLLAEYAYS
jgi:hypothetical protein